MHQSRECRSKMQGSSEDSLLVNLHSNAPNEKKSIKTMSSSITVVKSATSHPQQYPRFAQVTIDVCSARGPWECRTCACLLRDRMQSPKLWNPCENISKLGKFSVATVPKLELRYFWEGIPWQSDNLRWPWLRSLEFVQISKADLTNLISKSNKNPKCFNSTYLISGQCIYVSHSDSPNNQQKNSALFEGTFNASVLFQWKI